MSQLNAWAQPRKSGEGEGSTGQLGALGPPDLPPPPEHPSTVLLLPPLGCLGPPTPVYVEELPKSKAGSQGPFCMDTQSSTPQDYPGSLETKNTPPTDCVVPSLNPSNGSRCPWNKIPSSDRDPQTQCGWVPPPRFPSGPLFCLSNSLLTQGPRTPCSLHTLPLTPGLGNSPLLSGLRWEVSSCWLLSSSHLTLGTNGHSLFACSCLSSSFATPF